MFGHLAVGRLHPGRHCPEASEVSRARYRRAASRGVITFCATFPLLAAAPVMADETVGGTVGAAHTDSGQRSDQSIDMLLLKLEQQITAGHTLIPESDNAMETWRIVTLKAQSGSPEIRRALASFAQHLRERVATEQQAGRLVTATYFGVFAGMASDLVGADPAPTLRRAQTGAPVAAPADQVSPSVDSDAGPAGTGAPSFDGGAGSPPQPVASQAGSDQSSATSAATPSPSGAAASDTSSPAPRMGAAAEHPSGLIADAAQAAPVLPPSPASGDLPQSAVAALSVPSSAAPAPQLAALAAPPSPAASADTPVAKPPAPPGSAATSAGDSPRAAAGVADAPRTAAPSVQTALAVAPPLATPPAPPPAPRTPPQQDQAVAAALYSARGDQMLAIKDISAARRFYEYAANAGSARAAMLLAKTYDPGFLDELGVVGLRPDPAMATAWYRKAMELGDHDAEASLRRLSMDAAK